MSGLQDKPKELGPGDLKSRKSRDRTRDETKAMLGYTNTVLPNDPRVVGVQNRLANLELKEKKNKVTLANVLNRKAAQAVQEATLDSYKDARMLSDEAFKTREDSQAYVEIKSRGAQPTDQEGPSPFSSPLPAAAGTQRGGVANRAQGSSSTTTPVLRSTQYPVSNDGTSGPGSSSSLRGKNRPAQNWEREETGAGPSYRASTSTSAPISGQRSHRSTPSSSTFGGPHRRSTDTNETYYTAREGESSDDEN